MQDFNNIKIIGIDHGYGNIKTASTVTPTGVIVSDTEPTFDGNILFYNDKYYRFGEGHKRRCKKSPQEKRLQSCKKSKTAVFFCGIIKVS